MTFFYANLGIAHRMEQAAAQAAVAYVEGHKKLHPGSNAASIAVKGAAAAFVTVDSPLTHVINLAMSEPVEEGDLYEIESFFQERGAPVSIELCPLADLSAIEILNARGYKTMQFENVLARPIPADPFLFTPAHATVTPDAENWSRTLAKGFFDSPEPAEDGIEIGRIFHASEGLTIYGIELDGELCAGAALDIRDGIATLCADATIFSARGQGAQTALIQQRLIAARDAGCDIATASTLPGSTSQRNYERLGFRVMYTKTTLLKTF